MMSMCLVTIVVKCYKERTPICDILVHTKNKSHKRQQHFTNHKKNLTATIFDFSEIKTFSKKHDVYKTASYRKTQHFTRQHWCSVASFEFETTVYSRETGVHNAPCNACYMHSAAAPPADLLPTRIPGST